ncbi:unnamed protein product [Paramecium primaurelia]|uniref:Uncharacterized protein n=1 Tax=Paramecium primaurelia TaxID=5886 RepID=A0A8S1MZU0_PARPR|nr:unnamed protein product [Paramecium primaurelia]CAD8080406.1 unnamed protein product [Paramecium primaurelia]
MQFIDQRGVTIIITNQSQQTNSKIEQYIFINQSFHFSSQNDLISVQVVWRHGIRNYYHFNWNCIVDQFRRDETVLTPTDMRKQYVLGKWLRQRYIIENQLFLSSKFNENEIYIESSNENRTLTSAYCNLQRMYPDGPSIHHFQKENESIIIRVLRFQKKQVMIHYLIKINKVECKKQRNAALQRSE